MRHIALLAPALLVLAGCATTAPAADDGRLSVVASTDVYGSIAEAVGGDLVSVTSIIESAAQDPHSYEATARVRLALASADLVIENGGGYDPFVQPLLAANGGEVPVLTAVEFGRGPNEHVWYDLRAAAAIAEQLASRFAELDTANASTYTENAERFGASVGELETRATTLAGRIGGQGIAVTEVVPLYLLEAVGLNNLTPEPFTAAIEEGADVPPTALQATLELIGSGDVALLAYNQQTASAETERMREAAEAAGIPVVDFTETLPEGEDYLSWMAGNLDAIETALS